MVKQLELENLQSEKPCCWWQKSWLPESILRPCCGVPQPLTYEQQGVWAGKAILICTPNWTGSIWHTCRVHCISIWLVLKVAHLKWENEHLYVEGDTERIYYSVTDGNRFTKTLIVSRQVFKHTWEYITDTLQEYTDTLLFPKHAEKHFIFTIQKKTVLQWHPNLLILPSGQKLNFLRVLGTVGKGRVFLAEIHQDQVFLLLSFQCHVACQ